jgi:ketosteroid isomerase-like protein
MVNETKIVEIINAETHAFDTKDVELLLSIFHPDMVWPWPPNVDAHNPLDWVMPWGRYNRKRWHGYLEKFFDKYDLIHNVRQTRKIETSKEGDGAFAIVDVDTLWKAKSGDELHWDGRACKIYTTSKSKWLMISQTGLLKY